MKHFRQSIAILMAFLLCATGCVSVVHTRSKVGPDGKAVAIESESAHSFMAKEAISKLSLQTRDGAYTHSVSASGVTLQGDSEFVKTLIESTGTAVGNGMGAAAKSAVVP